MDSPKKPAETEQNDKEQQIAALLICTRFAESHLRSLDSHELNKLYTERILNR